MTDDEKEQEPTQDGDLLDEFPQLPEGTEIIGLKVGVSVQRAPYDPVTKESLYEPQKSWSEVEISTEEVDTNELAPWVRSTMGFLREHIEAEFEELGINSRGQLVKAKVSAMKSESGAREAERLAQQGSDTNDELRGLSQEEYDLAVSILERCREDKNVGHPKSRRHLGWIKGNTDLLGEGWDGWNAIKKFWKAHPEQFKEPWPTDKK